MPVITISRGSFSGGKMLAECLSKSLDYRLVDRDVIVERAAAHGVSQEELRNALEKPPGLLARFQHKRYLYLVLIQSALAAEVQTGRAVYHGHAGHLLLQGGTHVLRVRIIAPMEFRVKMAGQRLQLSDAEAREYIDRMDEDRRKWTQYLYGVDWRDASNYDMVLNLESMKIEEACRAVCSVARQRCFAFTSGCQQAMDNLVLASKVRAELALDSATRHLEFDVNADKSALRVRGSVSNMRDVAEIRRVASAVAGVESVNLDGVMAPVRV